MSMLQDDINEELRHRQEMLKVLRQRLHERELQAARYGFDVSPHITSEIDALRREISLHEQEIMRLRLLVESAIPLFKERTEPKPAPRQDRRYLMLIVAIVLLVSTCLPTSLLVARNFLNSRSSTVQNELPETDDAIGADSTAYGNISSTSMEPSSAINNQTVEDTIRSYYQALNSHNFDNAWSLLTPSYRQRHNSDGYQAYADYWGKEDKLNVDSFRVIQQDNTNAVVEIQVTYSNPTRTAMFRISLIRDKSRWFFDQYCEVEGQPRCSDSGIDGN